MQILYTATCCSAAVMHRLEEYANKAFCRSLPLLPWGDPQALPRHMLLCCSTCKVMVGGEEKCTVAAKGKEPGWDDNLEFILGHSATSKPNIEIVIELWDYKFINHFKASIFCMGMSRPCQCCISRRSDTINMVLVPPVQSCAVPKYSEFELEHHAGWGARLTLSVSAGSLWRASE